MELLKTLARKKKYLIWLAVLVAVGIVLKLTLFAPQLVKTVKIEKHDLTAQVYGNGTVEAKVVVGVSSKITGRIAARTYATRCGRCTGSSSTGGCWGGATNVCDSCGGGHRGSTLDMCQ